MANTIEEMETLIDEKMKTMNIENYYIYDFYNVEPKDYNSNCLHLIDIKNNDFEKRLLEFGLNRISLFIKLKYNFLFY